MRSSIVLAERGPGLGEGAVRRRPARGRRGSPTDASHAASSHWREPCSAARGTSPDAAWNTRASMPSRPASTRHAMWPSPRNSRSSVMACQSASARLVGPGSDGVAGVERTTGGGARRRRRRGPARRRAATVGSVEEVAGGPPQGAVRRARGARRAAPPASSPAHAAGMAWWTIGGVEVEERGDDDLGRHRTHRRGARGEVAVEAHHAERLVGRRRLGREVDQPVVRLEGPPHLPRHHRFHGAGP